MDDLKIFTRDNIQLETLLKNVHKFSQDMKMSMGLDKCAKATIRRGKLTKTEDIKLDIDTEIRELDQNHPYKYLGLDETDRLQHTEMKEKIRKKYYRRVRLVLKSDLNANY